MTGSSRPLRVPHVFLLLGGIVLLCSCLTYIVPSGSYDRVTKSIEGRNRTLVVPGTYRHMEKQISWRGVLFGDEAEGKASPESLTGTLSAIPRGMERSADIIFFIFIVGGVLGVLQKTGAIEAAIGWLIGRFGKSTPLLTVVLMTAVAAGGSTLGMGEEFIPLVPVFLAISYRIGFDRIYAVALVLLSAHVGFAAATTNPFTINVAQGIAELPLNSGIGLRLVFFVCALSLAVTHVLRYGKKLKKSPEASLAPLEAPPSLELGSGGSQVKSSARGILLSCTAIFVLILTAVQVLDWWMAEMAGGFLLMGVVAAAIGRLSPGRAIRAFVGGMEEMVVAALVVGFARGIQVVLQDGSILDTLIYSAASLLESVPPFVAAQGMLIFQAVLNFFIPSGSGQAAVTMPLMAPLADVLGISRQTAVFAFQCGDGFSNSIIPTSGILMAMLGIAKVPYEKWLRFVLPLFLQLILLSAVFLAIAVAIGYK